MLTNKAIVLGIDPGSRQIGVSVFKGQRLVFYGVKTIKAETEKKTIAKLRQVFSRLITEYGITHVALEEPAFIQQRKSFVRAVFENIQEILKEHGIGYDSYSPRVVRKKICENERATKAITFHTLALKYSELSRYVNVSRSWQKRYFASLLDAVAVGLVCAQGLGEIEAT